MRSERMISSCGNEPKSTNNPIWVMPMSRSTWMRSITWLRAAHDDAAGKIGVEAEIALAGLAALVAFIGGRIGRLARGLEAGCGVFAHRLVDDLLQLRVVVAVEEMGVIDAADLVILNPAPAFPQRAAIPADALDRHRMIDVIGDIEQVVALLRRPFETFRRHQAGDPDRRMRFLVDRRQ